MIALHAEPIRNNPAKLIGWYDDTEVKRGEAPIIRLFTVNFLPSDPMVVDPRRARPNKSHGQRIKAAERLGYTVVVDG